MKRKFMSTMAALTMCALIAGCSQSAASSQSTENGVGDIATVQYFTDEAVNSEDLTKIVTAGLNSPSGMNNQPWHFSVVTDKALLTELGEAMSANMPDAAKAMNKAGIGDVPAVIVVSGSEDSSLDVGIACGVMCAEADLLGYGTKIASSPANTLNQDNYKQKLGIPDGYNAITTVFVGKEDTSVDTSVDGYTAATERNAAEDMITYVNGE